MQCRELCPWPPAHPWPNLDGSPAHQGRLTYRLHSSRCAAPTLSRRSMPCEHIDLTVHIATASHTMSQFKCGYHSRVILWVPEGCTGLPYLASLSLPVHGSSMCCFHGTRAAFWSRAGRAAQQEWKWGFLVPADEMATNRNQQGWTSRSQAQLITPVQKGALVETAATKYINKQTSNTSIPSAPAPNSQCISCSSRWAEQHCMLLQAPAGAAQLLFAQSWIALRIKGAGILELEVWQKAHRLFLPN